jgi:hypothetical protein
MGKGGKSCVLILQQCYFLNVIRTLVSDQLPCLLHEIVTHILFALPQTGEAEFAAVNAEIVPQTKLPILHII